METYRRLFPVLLLSFTLSGPVIKGQRLPQTIIPLHYDLALIPILANNPRLCGHLYLDFEALTWTNFITIHSAIEIDILDITLDDKLLNRNNNHRFDQLEDVCFSGLEPDVNETIVSDIQFVVHEPDKNQLNIGFNRTIVPGQKYRLGIFYLGKINDTSHGFFSGSYKEENTCCVRWFGATQMEPTHARRVFPCMDEPGLKATFDITLGHEEMMKVLANMPESSSRPMNNVEGWMWTKFMETPKMSTYLLSLVVTNQVYVEREYRISCRRSILLRYWVKPEHIDYLNRTMEMLPKVLRYLEKHLKEPFPLPVINFVASPVPLTFMAMENWGLILLSEPKLLHDEEYDSQEDFYRDAQVIIHELIHQYFGNLVTPDWWDEGWIKEALTVLYEFLIIQELLPELEVHRNRAWVTAMQSVMELEEKGNSSSVYTKIEKESEIEKLFNQITYFKGSVLFNMLRNFMGPNSFRKGMITLVQRHKFGSITSSSLWNILNEEMNRYHDFSIGNEFSVTKVMESWTNQPSYPIVRCCRSGNWIRLTQKPFPIRNKTAPSSLWWIPITLTDSSTDDYENSFPRLWLTPQRPSLEVSIRSNSTDWILLNAGITGYFRVQYDEFNYGLISDQLVRNHSVFSNVIRSQLIKDAFTLAEIDLISHQIPLMMIRYLTMVEDEFVRPSVIWSLVRMINAKPEHSFLFKKYIDGLKQPQITSRSKNEHQLNDIDCELGDPNCVESALNLFHGFMKNKLKSEEKNIMADKFGTIFCTAIRHGGQEEWKSAWKKSTDPQWVLQREKIMSALTCSRDEKRLKKLLRRIHDDIIPADSKSGSNPIVLVVLEGMLSSNDSIAPSLARQFIKSNRKNLQKMIGNHCNQLERSRLARRCNFEKAIMEIHTPINILWDHQRTFELL